MIFLLDPRFWLAAMVLLGGAFYAGKWTEYFEAKQKIKQAQEKVEIVEDQWKTNAEALEEVKNAELKMVTTRLNSALRELRERSDRRPEASAPSCQGATGRELSGPDAEFLAGEAARAESLRAGLKECYGWVDEAEKQLNILREFK